MLIRSLSTSVDAVALFRTVKIGYYIKLACGGNDRCLRGIGASGNHHVDSAILKVEG